MDEAIRPLTGGPLLITKGALLTRIVVDSVQGLDGEKYNVMFIGTGKKKSCVFQKGPFGVLPVLLEFYF